MDLKLSNGFGSWVSFRVNAGRVVVSDAAGELELPAADAVVVYRHLRRKGWAVA